MKKEHSQLLIHLDFLFRSYFALPPTRSNRGFPTGLLTGFMNFVAGIGKDFKTDYIVLLLMQRDNF